jgi:hypothetical protein
MTLAAATMIVRPGARALSILALLTLASTALVGAAGATATGSERQSTTEISGNGAFSATFRGASADGTRVWFETKEQLVPADTDSAQDIYERSGAQTRLVSAGHINGNGAFDAAFVGASSDGSRVFFQSGEQLNAADTDFVQDIYERSAGDTKRVSVSQINGNPSSGNGPFDATFGGASDDGTHVFFETQEPLVVADTDSAQDIYERFGGNTKLVSNLGYSPGALDATFQHVSSDGSYVTFTTPYGSNQAIYSRIPPYSSPLSIEVNVTYKGATADGCYLFFVTDFQIASADTDSAQDVYEAPDCPSPGGALISAGQINGNGPIKAFFRGVSRDGTHVFFDTKEALVPSDTDSARDLYQHPGGLHSLEGGTTPVTTSNGASDASFRGLSDDGTQVFFETAEPLSGIGDTDAAKDVFVRSGDKTKRVSAGQINGNGAFDAAFVGASPDGSRVFFETAERLVAADTDSAKDIYERSTTGGLTETKLVSAGQINGNGSFAATFRGTYGTQVFFHTSEPLVADDTDAQQDVYSRDGNTTTRVSAG